MPTYIDVKPELLRWAINRSGLAVGDFDDATVKWLSGERRPTYNQIVEFAKRAMVPLGYLFLPAPPDEPLPLPDFRTREDDGVPRPSPNLIETIFEMKRRQDWMRQYLIDDGHEPLPEVGSAQVGTDELVVAKMMRDSLGLRENWAEHHKSWEDALRYLRNAIEEIGILIFINGIVGNNTHRALDPAEFQGFVLIDSYAPLIFVNAADFKVAQMFTIAHELVHVWVGQSALFDLEATRSADVGVEKYCNAVAAEFLVPASKIRDAWPETLDDDVAVKAIARQFKVSPIVVARRAKDIGLITLDEFFEFYARYTNEEREKKELVDGGDFWKSQNVRLGNRFGEAVVSAAKEHRITYSEAYDLTRLYGDSFDNYANRLAARRRL
jgi:Zn-dependent peptidase ImmA (M78 family)